MRATREQTGGSIFCPSISEVHLLFQHSIRVHFACVRAALKQREAVFRFENLTGTYCALQALAACLVMLVN